MNDTNTFWKQVKLGEVIRVKHGYAFKSEYFSNSGDYVLLTPGNFYEKGGLKFKDKKGKYYVGEIPSGFILKRNDLLVVMTEQAEGLLGSPGIIPENNRYLHNQRLGLIDDIDKNKIDKGFIYYLFNYKSIRNQIRATANGTKVRHTSPSRIYEVNALLPEVSTQRKIAAILSAYDDLVENNLRRIKILEEMAQNFYNEWFIKFNFYGQEKVKIVDSPLGRIPEGWKIVNLADMVDFIRGVEPGSRNYLDYPETGTVPFLRVGDFGDRASRIFVKEELVGDKILTKEDIALTLDGTVGIVRIGLQGAYSTGIRKVKIRDVKRLPWSYLYFLLLSEYMQQIIKANARGTTIIHAGSAIEHMVFPLPPIEVIRLFDDHTSLILKSIIILNDKVDLLCCTRDLLLHKLISREFDVSDLDIKTGDDE